MTIREFAERVLLSESMDQKLQSYEGDFSDDHRGDPLRVAVPGRPEILKFAPRRTAPSMPKPGALKNPAKRAIAHHIFANHELQALEVMAWTLCAFPEAPPEFRRGMMDIIADEQKHTRMHIERAKKLGLIFGELPVNCYIWKKAMSFESVLEYLAGLPLVFEGANLDHSLEFAEAFDKAGDTRSAALMRVIHRDEIEHVRFGLDWLRRLKPENLSDFEAFEKSLHWPLRASKARGTIFQRDARLKAGLDEEFVSRLEELKEIDF